MTEPDPVVLQLGLLLRVPGRRSATKTGPASLRVRGGAWAEQRRGWEEKRQPGGGVTCHEVPRDEKKPVVWQWCLSEAGSFFQRGPHTH